MAYEGYLVKYGSYPIPNNFIRKNSYKITPNARIDLDPYRDADAELQRNTLKHTVTKIEFETPKMYHSDVEKLMSNLRNNYQNYEEKWAMCTYFDFENNKYKTGKFYIPDVTFQVYSTAFKDILLDSIRIAFIEY